jgi:3-hydroxyacyl-CoA dehydrogenase/enoyl-CoA hydratase/3-hydroxybutyryl-CoA epimerase
MTTTHWTTVSDEQDILWLCLDKVDAKANVLSSAVLRELNDILDPLAHRAPRGAVIWSGKARSFIMGADINEFQTLTDADTAFDLVRQGQQIMDKIERLACPTVAVINGVCMGGGLELALACDYRIAFGGDKKILGLPEVKLGLHPGFGGTVRTVRLCGVRAAMPIMLTGDPVRPNKAKAIGLIDKITDDASWRDDALKFIRNTPAKSRAPFVDRILNVGLLRPALRKVLLQQVRGKARKEHYPAPYAMIDLWATVGASGMAAYEAEARSFSRLVCTSTSRNLVKVFFMQSKLKAQGHKTAAEIARVHVVGAGVMGGDIAAWCALRGLRVTLQDREQKYIDPAMQRAARLFAKRVRDDAQRSEVTARLQSDVNGDGVAKADLIIEAIYENLEAKQALYETLQKSMKPGALLASNTSSIRLEELRTVAREPRRFIGLHFFNPVAMLPLVEVIRCADTEREALDIAFAFTRKIGKLPLECASSPGFVVNRILAPYMGEAMQLAEEGVALADIDRAAEDFGMPVGPVELADSVGLDVALHVSKVLSATMNRPISGVLVKMVEDGLFGRKSDRGFYQWQDGKAVKPASNGSVPEDLQDRLILPMINEAVACLSEGVVTDAELLDAGVIFGTGFAPFRGGPLNYAKERGITEITSQLRILSTRHGARFDPHPGWSDL